VFAGIAVTDWATSRGLGRRKAAGVAAGLVVGGGLLGGFASLLVAVGAGDEDASRPREVTREPTVSDQRGRIALVSAAARQTGYAHVDLVTCERGEDALCVVTYTGPACQLWAVENVNGDDTARALGKPDDGGHGTYDEERDTIGCFFDLSP
jgi:hypothetical protein